MCHWWGTQESQKKKKIISNPWSVIDNDSHHHSPFINIFGKLSHLKKKLESLICIYEIVNLRGHINDWLRVCTQVSLPETTVSGTE